MLLTYAVLFSFPPLLLFYAISGLYYNPSKWRKYIPAFLFFVFIIICAFNLKDGTNKDLVRYYEWLDLSSKLSLAEISQYFNDDLYVMHLIYWVIGRLGIHQLLPALSITIVMLSVTYITCDLAEYHGSFKSIKYVLLLQLMFLPSVYVMETVRSGLAYSLIIILAYLDMVKGKKSIFIILGYFCCVFIHHSAVIFIVLRIMCMLPVAIKKLLIFFPLLVMPMVYYLQDFIDTFGLGHNVFLAKFVHKALVYSTNEVTAYGMYAEKALTMFFLKIVMTTEAVLILVIVFYLLRNNVVKEKRHQSFLYFFGFINLLTLAMVPMPVPIYWRIASAGYACCGAYMIPVRIYYNRLPFVIKLAYKTLWLCAIPSLIFQIHWIPTYIDSYLSWGCEILMTNYYTVLIDVLKNLL